MKRLSIIIIISIVFSLYVIPIGCVNAEPIEEQTQNVTAEVEIENNNDDENEAKSQPEEQTNDNTSPTQVESNDSTEQINSTNQTTSTKESNSSNKSNSNTKQTTTNRESKKSNNANLSNLGFTPNDFKGFKPDTLTYNVTVPNDIEKINVYAKAQDNKAQIISGTGNHNLDIGANDIQVIVTAENGDTKTYIINVVREEMKTEQTTTTKEDEAENSDLKKLEIKGYSLNPIFSPNIYEYKLDVKSDVTNLDVITEGLNDKVNIEVAGNTDLKER